MSGGPADEFDVDPEELRKKFWDDADAPDKAEGAEPGVKPNGVDPNPWPVLDGAARYGLAGEIVNAVAPHSEADPAALLIQVLASFGNAVGRGPYYQVEGDRHATNLFALVVGETARARKGVSKGRVEQFMKVADPVWVATRVDSGLSSGEGLIWAVRDAVLRWERQGKGTDAVRVEVVVDPGIEDKRLYVIETEFSSVLAACKREGNTLSRVVRDAWDRSFLATLTKNSPARATGALVSIVGHITAEELRRDLDRVSMANGLINRFLIICARRANVLPFGGALEERVCHELGARLGLAIENARNVGSVGMDGETRAAWNNLYPALSEGHPGLFGAVVARAEAQTVRTALVYALLDGAAEINLDHLKAATAVWEYAEASARYVFGDQLGDPVADGLLDTLRQAGAAGRTRNELREQFQHHGQRLSRALATLVKHGKVRMYRRTGTGGRPAEVWTAT
jgi:Protein of unknown function (DUF3987)